MNYELAIFTFLDTLDFLARDACISRKEEAQTFHCEPAVGAGSRKVWCRRKGGLWNA
jgi:hypothetical protein